MKVLVIDDDDEIRELVRMTLSVRGHTSLEATTGRDGLALALSGAPDLILLDVMMPGMDGPETLQGLRARPETARIPVAFVTASVMPVELDRLRALHPAGIIAKPFDPIALATRLEAMMTEGGETSQDRTDPARAAPGGAGGFAIDAGGDPEFERLRQNYVKRSIVQLDAAAEILTRVRSGAADAATLQDLMRTFHRFAGVAASFGSARAGALGKEGELHCLSLIREGRLPTAADLDSWTRLLDAIREEVALPPEAAAPAPGPSGEQPPAILVVDADPEVRATLAQLLANEGVIATEASSQSEALAAVARSLPDGVITDVALPDGNGYAFVEKLRALPEGENLPILVMSPHSAFADKVEAVHCGADAYFEKPVDWKALLRRLQHLLERSRPEPFRVLSVEDDPDQAAFIESVLASGGHQVRICSDPAQFDAALLEFQPDLVIMDIVLPGVTGYDLVRYLRQDERHVTLPVLFLTTEGQLQSRFRAARAGGDDHLVKPVHPSLLLATVSARVERARFIKSLLERDGLTRLLTHSAFAGRAEAAHADKGRHPERLYAWVMVDVDHFKSVNDRFGHPIGDRVLVALAALLRRRLRQTDTIGRYGGEEFAVLFEGLPEPEVKRLIDRVRADFGAIAHEATGKPPFHTTFSAGIAMLEPVMSVDAWKTAADDALYAAKHGGRNRVVCASEPVEAAPPAAVTTQ